MARPKLHVSITSDPLCPWCFIGTRRLLSLLQGSSLAQEFDFDPIEDLEWHPYRLFPSSLVEMSKVDFYKQRYGPNIDKLKATLEGEAQDIAFNFTPQARLGPSHEAHRLILLTPPAKRLELMMRLFQAYHVQGLSLSQRSTLDQCARGLVDSSVLDQDTGKDELRVELQRSKEAIENSGFAGGGVPFFAFTLIDVDHEKETSLAFSGAQSELYFTQVLKRAKARLLEPGPQGKL